MKRRYDSGSAAADDVCPRGYRILGGEFRETDVHVRPGVNYMVPEYVQDRRLRLACDGT